MGSLFRRQGGSLSPALPAAHRPPERAEGLRLHSTRGRWLQRRCARRSGPRQPGPRSDVRTLFPAPRGRGRRERAPPSPAPCGSQRTAPRPPGRASRGLRGESSILRVEIIGALTPGWPGAEAAAEPPPRRQLRPFPQPVSLPRYLRVPRRIYGASAGRGAEGGVDLPGPARR